MASDPDGVVSYNEGIDMTIVGERGARRQAMFCE